VNQQITGPDGLVHCSCHRSPYVELENAQLFWADEAVGVTCFAEDGGNVATCAKCSRWDALFGCTPGKRVRA